MNTELPAAVATAFETHDSIAVRDGDGVVTTTAFEGTVTARTEGEPTSYTVRVQMPTLAAATADDIGRAVADDWLRTLRRRLEDAPQATRATVDLDSFSVDPDGDTVQVAYGFSQTSPAVAADIATTFVEFAEGTYVEGVVPGYEYEPPVSGLLAQASQGEEGGTPL